MIPRLDIAVGEDLDVTRIQAPDRGTVRYPAWLGTQRDYDAQLYDAATWDAAAGVLAEERGILADLDRRARDEREFDELAYEEFEADGVVAGYLELGLTGLVTALNAAGCITASSCRGHPDEIRASPPQVLLACDRPRARLLLTLAGRAGCGIANSCGTGVVVYARSVAELLQLGELVVRHRSAFDALPLSAERRDPAESSREPDAYDSGS